MHMVPEAKNIKLIECPRDAMQGISAFIPTQDKIDYLNLLLQAGFDVLDSGSFVSPKAIPQMADTREVLAKLELNGNTSLLAIIANFRGAMEASQFDEITYLGYPFSISETFQRRNTNTSIQSSAHLVSDILELCDKANKQAVIYLSMAFGNPYGDEWGLEIAEHWVNKLINKGAKIISLSDTTGTANPESISKLYGGLSASHSKVEFGLHLHSTPDTWYEKVDAAYKIGCRRFDSALKGFGGCPMAEDKLTGNIATENLISYLHNQGENLRINASSFQKAMEFSSRIFA